MSKNVCVCKRKPISENDKKTVVWTKIRCYVFDHIETGTQMSF